MTSNSFLEMREIKLCGSVTQPIVDSVTTIGVIDKATNKTLKEFSLNTLGQLVQDKYNNDSSIICKSLNMSGGDALVHVKIYHVGNEIIKFHFWSKAG